MNFTAEEIWGVIRTILAAIAGWAAGQGYVDNDTAMAIIGALGTIFVGVWSIKNKRKLLSPK